MVVSVVVCICEGAGSSGAVSWFIWELIVSCSGGGGSEGVRLSPSSCLCSGVWLLGFVGW